MNYFDMSIDKAGRPEAAQKAETILEQLSLKLSRKHSFETEEAQAAIRALQEAVESLEEWAIISAKHEHKIDKVQRRFHILDLVDKVRSSPNFSIALGVFQSEFAGLLFRIEQVFIRTKGTPAVSKVTLDRLDAR